MNVRDALEALEGIYAYDTGSRGSGVHDESLRAKAVGVLDATSEDDLRWELSRWVRGAYLSERALQQGYGWEDARAFLSWIHDGDYRVGLSKLRGDVNEERDRYRQVLERVLIELRGTTAEGGDAEAIIRFALRSGPTKETQ